MWQLHLQMQTSARSRCMQHALSMLERAVMMQRLHHHDWHSALQALNPSSDFPEAPLDNVSLQSMQ
jgi:hypothetical protein